MVELGIQIEINGRCFYDGIADKSRSVEARKVFRFLAGEENKHIEDFKKILDSVINYEPVESYPQEYFSYMNSMVSRVVFTQDGKGEEIAKTTTSDRQAIELAIGFEKDSIEFYEGMKRMIPEHDKRLLDELIAQEHDHIKKLQGLGEL
jgi:rubrerythrin